MYTYHRYSQTIDADDGLSSSLIHEIGDFLYFLSSKLNDLLEQTANPRKPSTGTVVDSADTKRPAENTTRQRYLRAASTVSRLEEAVHLLRQTLSDRGVLKDDIAATVAEAEKAAKITIKKSVARREAALEKAQLRVTIEEPDPILSEALAREVADAIVDSRNGPEWENPAEVLQNQWHVDAVHAYSLASLCGAGDDDWRASHMIGVVLEAAGAPPEEFLSRYQAACDIVGTIDVIDTTGKSGSSASAADVVECHYRLNAAAWAVIQDDDSDLGVLDRCTRTAFGNQRRFAGTALKRAIVQRVVDGLNTCVNA